MPALASLPLGGLARLVARHAMAAQPPLDFNGKNSVHLRNRDREATEDCHV